MTDLGDWEVADFSSVRALLQDVCSQADRYTCTHAQLKMKELLVI